MAYAKGRIPSTNHCNICFDCKNSCGRCSWSEIDPTTGRVRFELPEGCVTEKAWRRMDSAGRKYAEAVRIVACPLFERG